MNTSLWFAQITDSHIVPHGQNWLNIPEAQTHVRLSKVVKDINNLTPLPQFVIHSGDITDRGDIESYVHAKEILDQLKVPYYLCCGNHDNYKNLKKVFKDHVYLKDNDFACYSIDVINVRLVVIDSVVPYKSHGTLAESQKIWLEKELESSALDKIIVLHHHPFRVQHNLFSELHLRNSPDLEKILLKHKNIKGILCGHYHFASATIFAGTLCWICPSVSPSHDVDDLESGNKVTRINLHEPAYTLHQYNQVGLNSRVINVSSCTKK